MTALIDFSRNTQRAVCALIATIVVITAGFSIATYAPEAATHQGYSVTIEQLS